MADHRWFTPIWHRKPTKQRQCGYCEVWETPISRGQMCPAEPTPLPEPKIKSTGLGIEVEP